MKKEKNKKHIIFIVIVCILGVLMYISPYVLLMIGFAYTDDYVDYKVEDNKLILEKEAATISNMKGYYKDECYVIEYSIDNKEYDEIITLDFNVYDSEDYILGLSSQTIDVKENNKYKTKAYYCDDNAKNVVRYTLKGINAY